MRIIILFNHFQIQDGVARCVIGMANALSKKPGVEVTLCPLFRYDVSMLEMLDEHVLVKPVFKIYFRGLAKIVGLIPMSFLYKWIIGDRYDIKIGACMTLPIRIVSADPKLLNQCNRTEKVADHFAWMHGYDVGLTLFSAYKRIGKVVCVSKYCADKLSKESNGEFQVDYAYNLLNDNEIRKKGGEVIPIARSEAIQFVSVGRMTPEKGYMRLLDICQRLVKERYRFCLWLIGDGPQKVELEKKAFELGLGEVVIFWGEQKNPHAFTSKSDVFICSSYDEGYSTACTEAIILGVPVITTSVSGGEEIIAEAECGLLVGMENEDLYNGLKMILDNPDIINKWKRILDKTKDRFSYRYRVKRLYHVLEMDQSVAD